VAVVEEESAPLFEGMSFVAGAPMDHVSLCRSDVMV
jgi:hypothetical protein